MSTNLISLSKCYRLNCDTELVDEGDGILFEVSIKLIYEFEHVKY